MTNRNNSKANDVSRPWNHEDEVLLYTLREDGIPYKLIATELHRSVKACEHKFQATNWSSTSMYDPVKGRMYQKIKQAYIEKLAKAQDNKHKLSKMFIDIITDKIVQAVVALPNVPKPVFKKTSQKHIKHADEDVGLILSDAHIGHHHTFEETGGISEYNIDVFKKRMHNLMAATKDITELHSKLYNLPVLHIFSLGDIVAGMNSVGAWSPTYINLPIYDQVIIGVESIAEAIYYWLGMFKEIRFYGIVGNHGRCAPSGVEKEYVNWDLICYRFLEARFKDNPRVIFNVPLQWWIMTRIRNHNFLMVHGDSIRGTNPLKKLIELEEKMTGILKKMPDYTLAAHFHCPGEISTNHGRVIISGSFVGSDIYSLKDLKSSVRPEQKIFGIHDKRGITWTYNLNLGIDR